MTQKNKGSYMKLKAPAQNGDETYNWGWECECGQIAVPGVHKKCLFCGRKVPAKLEEA